jgi:hypothetical protein
VCGGWDSLTASGRILCEQAARLSVLSERTSHAHDSIRLASESRRALAALKLNRVAAKQSSGTEQFDRYIAALNAERGDS